MRKPARPRPRSDESSSHRCCVCGQARQDIVPVVEPPGSTRQRYVCQGCLGAQGQLRLGEAGDA